MNDLYKKTVDTLTNIRESERVQRHINDIKTVYNSEQVQNAIAKITSTSVELANALSLRGNQVATSIRDNPIYENEKVKSLMATITTSCTEVIQIVKDNTSNDIVSQELQIAISSAIISAITGDNPINSALRDMTLGIIKNVVTKIVSTNMTPTQEISITTQTTTSVEDPKISEILDELEKVSISQ